MQNLAPHGIEEFRPPEEFVALLGPRCLEYWNAVAAFWVSVAQWCVSTQAPLKPGEQILSVQNEQLRALLWTGNRSLPAGTCVDLADAVRYEQAGGDAIPGYSHVMAAIYPTRAQLTGLRPTNADHHPTLGETRYPLMPRSALRPPERR